MKFIKPAVIGFTLTLSAPVFADDPQVVNQPSGADFVYDVVLRPAGFVSTVLGTGFYLAMSPFTAITSLQPPHNQFEKFADLVVVNPYKFTFTRPVGDYNFPQTER
ncbi:MULTISPECIES: hypothetical protein [Methylomicrobium]|uniref:Uncharacterized protein n=1 Tax=Methylomicrobium album BG8 TaxID=686340 RepID=H8GR20_METAL|nr:MULTISPECIES: hypothetical protein [Methylomicrobium]EIC28679.1 hypothetical protein Metal_0850 [Methylomicrobium album BG8]